MKLVIERDRWLRGEAGSNSRLLREDDGKMCCLGFLGLACGMTEDQIRDHSSPAHVDTDKWPAWLYGEDDGRMRETFACSNLIDTNDDEALGAAEREQRLTELFAKHGVEVEFK